MIEKGATRPPPPRLISPTNEEQQSETVLCLHLYPVVPTNIYCKIITIKTKMLARNSASIFGYKI
jgi:hypothetical protein